MNTIGRAIATGLAALAIHAPVWAATAGSSASLNDITFEVLSLDNSPDTWLAFGEPGGEATYVQVSASDSQGNGSFTFNSDSSLYASLYESATVSEGSGLSQASASSGSSWLAASGSTSISLGSYAAEAGLNQSYQGTNILGGWFTVSAMTQVTLTAYFNIESWISGTPCGPTGVCSSAFSQARAGIGDDVSGDDMVQWLQVAGEGGPTYAQRSGRLTSTYRNLLDVATDVFFFTSATVWGSAGDAADDNGGGGNVPEPAAWTLLLGGLGALMLVRGRRNRQTAGAFASPSLAA